MLFRAPFETRPAEVVAMAREYDHLFKLLIIGDSGKPARLFTRTNQPSSFCPSLCPRQEWGRAVCCCGSQTTCSQVSQRERLTAHLAPDRSSQPNPSHLSIPFIPPYVGCPLRCLLCGVWLDWTAAGLMRSTNLCTAIHAGTRGACFSAYACSSGNHLHAADTGHVADPSPVTF